MKCVRDWGCHQESLELLGTMALALQCINKNSGGGGGGGLPPLKTPKLPSLEDAYYP